jgi:DNA-binding transcriptional LysR family regulator
MGNCSDLWVVYGSMRSTTVAAVVTVVPVWERRLSTYPQIHLELHVGNAPVYLIAEGFDAGIGPKELADPNMSTSPFLRMGPRLHGR